MTTRHPAGERPPGLGRTTIGPREFVWGERTFVMGIVNVTPDSFSGDGLLAGRSAAQPVERAVLQALRMAAENADILDVGGESTRPGHDAVDAREETTRVVPVIAAIRSALPDMPISVDTTKPSVAEAALAAGADMLNDVWGVAADEAMVRVAAGHAVPIVLMHNRSEARYTNLIAEIVGELETAIERALRVGVAREQIVIDPGFGFGKTAEHNLALLRGLDALRVLERPILLGTSRKSTLGKVLDLPADERLEATLATTALGIASGTDIVRVHDVRPNVRAARMTDAIVRGTSQPGSAPEGGSS
jgi:dihydropteroate synthase